MDDEPNRPLFIAFALPEGGIVVIPDPEPLEREAPHPLHDGYSAEASADEIAKTELAQLQVLRRHYARQPWNANIVDPSTPAHRAWCERKQRARREGARFQEPRPTRPPSAGESERARRDF